MQSCPLCPGQESQGTTRPQLHLPEPTSSLRCWGQMLLTLEPTDGQAGDPTGLAGAHAAVSLMPPATPTLLRVTLCLPCHREGPHSR